MRERSSASVSNNNTPAAEASTSASQALAPGERRLVTEDPMKALKPHYEKIATTSLSAKRHFATGQLGWSPDGRWLVASGDNGMIVVFHRENVA